MTLPRTLTPRELAAETGIPRSTWYDLIARGELEAIRIGRSVRVTEAVAAEYLRTRTERAS